MKDDFAYIQPEIHRLCSIEGAEYRENAGKRRKLVADVRNNRCYLICLRHLIILKAFPQKKFPEKKNYFLSCVCNMF